MIYDPSLSILITQKSAEFRFCRFRAEAVLDARNIFGLSNQCPSANKETLRLNSQGTFLCAAEFQSDSKKSEQKSFEPDERKYFFRSSGFFLLTRETKRVFQILGCEIEKTEYKAVLV